MISNRSAMESNHSKIQMAMISEAKTEVTTIQRQYAAKRTKRASIVSLGEYLKAYITEMQTTTATPWTIQSRILRRHFLMTHSSSPSLCFGISSV